MSVGRMDVQNTDYDAAQALLDLQGNMKQENPEEYNVWRDNNSREDMDKAAKLIWSCFISSEVPTDTNTNLLDSNYKNKATTLVSKDINPVFHNNSDERKLNIKGRNNITKPKILSRFDKAKWENSNYNNFNKCIVKPKAKNPTRDVGTQTEERHFNPNIELMETTIQNLCDRIKSLEAQLKEPTDISAEQSGFVSSENESNYENDDNISGPSNNDFDMNASEERIHESNASQCSAYSVKDQYDSYYPRRSTSHIRNNSFNDCVINNRNVYKNSNDMVPIGDGNATVPSRILKHINWSSYTSATRKLLTAVFTRRILATHSLTGKPSPAFPNKPAKKKLDPALVNDIVQTVVERCSVPENVVRTSITTKCADESKMFRTRQRNNKKRINKKDRENVPPATSDSETENYN